MTTPEGSQGAQFDSITATSRHDVWAVGYSYTAHRDEHTLAEHFDGHTWTIVPTPDIPVSDGPELSAVSAISPADAWAVGLRDEGDSQAPLILHWNGHVWRESRAPLGDAVAFLNAVSGSTADDVWAVGSTGGKTGVTVTYHWDGHHWRITSSRLGWLEEVSVADEPAATLVQPERTIAAYAEHYWERSPSCGG